MRIKEKLSICYILNSFPEASETFISEEIRSVVDMGIDLQILKLNIGKSDVVHLTTKKVLNSSRCTLIDESSRWRMLLALHGLMHISLLRTLRTLLNALQSENRWCYFLTLPTAIQCLVDHVDFLHAHYVDKSFLYAKTISEWTGIPYGVTAHRYDIFDDPLTIPLASELLGNANAIITISEYNRHFMANKYGLKIENIDIIHCGIDLNLFSYSQDKVFFPNQTLRLLNIGRLVEVKGQHILLQAVRLVIDRGVPCTLEIIGGGPLHETLMQFRKKLGLDDVVKILGAQPELVVRERLQAADLFVLSSHSEGIPVVCMEAMGMGTPVIATRITGIPELIEHSVSGFLVEPGDSVALADMICHAYSQPEMLSVVRGVARRTVEQGFERKSCTERLVACWQSSIAATSRTP
jgi:colanic acid/amylovoran biosynthesis glycosyltransferase